MIFDANYCCCGRAWNSPDLVIYPPDSMVCQGWQAAHDMFAQLVKANRGATIQLDDPQYLVAGDYVIDHGLWTITMPTGEQVHGRYTVVMAMKDGKWVFVLDHPSVPTPPPATQPG